MVTVRELCEWAPLKNRAANSDEDPDACLHSASVCVGDGRWHLCVACADLAPFRRFKKRPLREGVSHERNEERSDTAAR
jgi:hypothetical protein